MVYRRRQELLDGGVHGPFVNVPPSYGWEDLPTDECRQRDRLYGTSTLTGDPDSPMKVELPE